MHRNQRQLLDRRSREYGGRSRIGRRKVRRPFDPKRPLHLVFRAARARGPWSFLHQRHKAEIPRLLRELAERYGARVYRYENVGNHIRLLARFRERKLLRAFLRVFPQRLMFLVTGAKKGQPRGRFFDAIAYSRIVEWGREFRALREIVGSVGREAAGFDRETVMAWRRGATEGPS